MINQHEKIGIFITEKHTLLNLRKKRGKKGINIGQSEYNKTGQARKTTAAEIFTVSSVKKSPKNESVTSPTTSTAQE